MLGSCSAVVCGLGFQEFAQIQLHLLDLCSKDPVPSVHCFTTTYLNYMFLNWVFFVKKKKLFLFINRK